MKLVERYVAEDGTEFSTEAKCMVYENKLRKANDIMSNLKPLPKDSHCDFANGDGYIQQDIDRAKVCAEAILELVKSCTGEEIYDKAKGKAFECRYGIIGRYLCDNEHPANSAWCRLGCIDNNGKEWGQAYFAVNPGKGKNQEYKGK